MLCLDFLTHLRLFLIDSLLSCRCLRCYYLFLSSHHHKILQCVYLVPCYPHLPVIYPCVFSFSGFVKIFCVSPVSTSSPRWKKPVRCDTLAACCIECVTITIVYLVLSSSINSSIVAVAIGSNAEQVSYIKIISGLTAIARAIHNRCC